MGQARAQTAGTRQEFQRAQKWTVPYKQSGMLRAAASMLFHPDTRALLSGSLR